MNALKTAINKIRLLWRGLFLVILLPVYGGIPEDLVRALSEKDEARKLKLYEKILAEDPGQSSAYYNRGIIFMRQKAWQEARLDFRKYTELEPRDALGFHNFAVCCYSTGEYAKALSAWESALVLKPHEMDFIKGKVLCLIKLKQGEKVRSFLETYAATEPILWLKVELLVSENAPEQEIQTLIQRILGFNPDSEKALYEQALYLLRKNMIAEAKMPLSRLVKLPVNNADYQWMYAGVLLRLKEYEAAFEQYEALKSNEAYRPGALEALEEICEALGKKEELLKIYSALLELHPREWKYCRAKLAILIRDKREEEALETLNAWHAGNSESFESLQYLIHLTRKKVSKEERLGLLRRALMFNPVHPAFLEEMVFSMLQDGKQEEAESFLSAMIRKNPCFTHFYLRGLIYARMSRFEEALGDWNRALELEAGNLKVLQNRAKIFIKMKKYPEALKDLIQAEKISDKDSGYWLLRSKAEHFLGKEKEAVRDYERAKQIKKDLPDYEYYFSVFNQEGADF